MTAERKNLKLWPEAIRNDQIKSLEFKECLLIGGILNGNWSGGTLKKDDFGFCYSTVLHPSQMAFIWPLRAVPHFLSGGYITLVSWKSIKSRISIWILSTNQENFTKWPSFREGHQFKEQPSFSLYNLWFSERRHKLPAYFVFSVFCISLLTLR